METDQSINSDVIKENTSITQHNVSWLFKHLFIIYFLAVLGLRCCTGFSLVAASGGSSLVVVRGLLIAVASLVAELGL